MPYFFSCTYCNSYIQVGQFEDDRSRTCLDCGEDMCVDCCTTGRCDTCDQLLDDEA